MNINHIRNPKFIGGTLKTCPLCKSKYNAPSALSRKDNKTEICPMCGQKEALEDYLKVKHDKES